MSDFDMERICRLCCTIKNRMRPLLEQRPEYLLTLSQMIYAIADIQVNPNDGLPQNICLACVLNLEKMYQTIQSYRENDSNLRKQLHRTKPDDIEDMVEIEEISVKQECADDGFHESEPLLGSKPTNESGESQDALGYRKLSVELDIPIKNEPLNEHDDNSQLDADARPADDVLIPKQGRVHSKVGEPIWPNEFDYKCYICKSESHGTADALLVHLNTNHKDLLPFTCSECVKETVVLDTLRGLNKHLRQHLSPEKCPHCDKRYLNKSLIAFHVQQHHRKTEDDSAQQCPIKCNHCDEEYPSKFSLKQHVKLVHSASATVSCAAGRDRIRVHLERQHGQNRKQFKCKFCPKKLTSLQNLKSHERRHARNPNFKAPQNWTQYFTTIEGQEGIKRKKRKCNICGLITAEVRQHIRAAHLSITYDCDICGKKFKYLAGLKYHKACVACRRNNQINPIC